MADPSIHLLDGVAAGVLLIGAGIGFVRGSAWMAIRIGTLAAAYLATRLFARRLGEILIHQLPMTPRAAGLLGAAILFLGVLSAGGVVSWLWKAGTRKRRLDGWSRLAGAACGAVSAAFVLAVGFVVAAPWIPASRSDRILRRSAVARASVLVLGEVPFVLPPSLRPQLAELVRQARGERGGTKPPAAPPAPLSASPGEVRGVGAPQD